MSQDKEREIQLQFLEEAQEYLDTIETVLLELSHSGHIDGQQMDAVLRAAHSVKGGAGMMGYHTLSQLAHRMEDSFKVLKAQKNSINVDDALLNLLLSAVDRLCQVLRLNRQGSDVDEQWLATVGNPVFEKLHERLGDPVADDAATMLGAEDGTNVAALLFETEVEGCLARLESVLADSLSPCLGEELEIMAQELGGLGEMLQLDAFTQLCESIVGHLQAAPERVREIAVHSLALLRRSQALVLVGQNGSLPRSLDIQGMNEPEKATLLTNVTEEEDEENSLGIWEQGAFDELEISVDEESLISRSEDVLFPTLTEVVEEADDWSIVAAEVDVHPASFTTEPMLDESEHRDTLDEFDKESIILSPSQSSRSQGVQTDSRTGHNNTFSVPSEVRSAHNVANAKETQENSVRVPIRQLDILNDLFGELTIERNGLSLHLTRLRSLVESLKRRVSLLEQSNVRLRTAYDTVATQAAITETGDRRVTTNIDPVHLGQKRKKEPTTNTSNNYYPLPITLYPSLNPSSSHSLFDALELDRYSDLHLLSMEVMETIVQIQEATSDITLTLEDTDQTTRELNQTAKQLQTNLTRVRMRPLSDLVGRYDRALRDLCSQYNKQVELKVYGKGTLIDRSILEALSDPLMHLVRNAFDHGIESPASRQAQGKSATGTIEIKAAHRGNQTLITVSDDGNGINLEKIRRRAEAMGLDSGLLAAASDDELLSLIFEPGFSTAEQVTTLSGRGVGMDVVRNNLKRIRGDIRVDTQPGKGTTFTLTVPFTLSVARVLLVESNGMLLAFPTDVIEEMLLLRPEDVLTTPGSEVLKWGEEIVPLTRLRTWLQFNYPRRVTTLDGVPTISEPTVLMISQGDQLQALQVDRCWGEREVAIRQVEGTLPMPPGFAGCTILGDGKVVPLVDALALLRWIATRPISSSENSYRSSLNGGATVRGATPHRNKYEEYGLNDNSIANLGTSVKKNQGENYLTSVSPAESSPAFSPASFDNVRQKDTILVVDDSINVRRFLALALEKAGYLVEQAKDGQDAVEKLLGGCRVSAVICDIEMPRLDGYGFLARVKSDPSLSQLPIAMLTSRSGEKHRQLAMTLGAVAYFSKPYNERELLTTMRTVITENLARKPVHSGII